MENYCAFSKNHTCLKWIDYQLTRHELEEADALCHGNWIEIQRLYRRIDTLEALLRKAGIDIPDDEFQAQICPLDKGWRLLDVSPS